jgi:hypothetical protein
MLAVHPDIFTTSETWILLPIVYSLRKYGTYAQYSHISFHNAVNDVLAQLPNGRKDIFESISLFAKNIYRKLNYENKMYFLDKTPRYYLILKEISHIFPEAKFIFLFRNPLSVMSSMINTFYQGRLGDWRHKIDLFGGPHLLSQGYQRLKSRSIAVRYEDLVEEPQLQLKSICDYLKIEYTEALITNFSSARLIGKMGDQVGSNNYSRIETQTMEKWKTTLGTGLRKQYAKYYLKKIGPDIISTFGYDMNQLIKDVDALDGKMEKVVTDSFQLLLCNIRIFFEIPLLKQNLKKRLTLKGNGYIHF